MSLSVCSLSQLGWRPFFSQQLGLEDAAAALPARVAAVHRSVLDVFTDAGELQVAVTASLCEGPLASAVAVGDWVLLEPGGARVVRVLDRQSVLGRFAAGERQQRQLIAANVDWLFIVTSCNDDFNPSRLERYLALAREAGVEPVLVVTKADEVASPDPYLDTLRSIAPDVSAVALDATSAQSVALLQPWLGAGQTVAFVGSSGVGKSTLVNTLTGSARQATGGIREDDSKGRHTTTFRQLVPLPGGAWVIDTPGMRELKLDVGAEAMSAVFADIEALAARCRFRDCSHQGDAGCAVTEAVAQGVLEARRLGSYFKLQREVAQAARTTHQRHEAERRFNKMVRDTVKMKFRHRN
jgi:ribosome biogenesis GTPase